MLPPRQEEARGSKVKAARRAPLAHGAGARGTRGGDPPDPSVLRRFLTHLELFFGVIALSSLYFEDQRSQGSLLPPLSLPLVPPVDLGFDHIASPSSGGMLYFLSNRKDLLLPCLLPTISVLV